MSQEAKPAPVMATEAWEDDLSLRLHSAFNTADSFAIVKRESYRGQPWAESTPDSFRQVILWMRDNAHFDYLADLTAVDHPSQELRFELIAVLYSFEHNRYVRVKTRFAETYEIESLTPIFVAADWLEREIYDMFGIEFAGHPNLKRILLPEDWQGFPLRKERSIVEMDQKWVQKHLGIESGQ